MILAAAGVKGEREIGKKRAHLDLSAKHALNFAADGLDQFRVEFADRRNQDTVGYRRFQELF
jgi:hypothetical protein